MLNEESFNRYLHYTLFIYLSPLCMRMGGHVRRRDGPLLLPLCSSGGQTRVIRPPQQALAP